MAYGLSNGHVIDDVTWPPCCEAVRSAILATAWLLVIGLQAIATLIVSRRVCLWVLSVQSHFFWNASPRQFLSSTTSR